MFLGKNLNYLRKSKGLNQDEMQAGTGIKRTTWSSYENSAAEPPYDVLIQISKYFGVKIDDILTKNMEYEAYNVEVNGKLGVMKNGEFVEAKVERNIEPKAEFIPNLVQEPPAIYGKKDTSIPIVELSVAAGAGLMHDGHIETVDFMHLPPRLLKTGNSYLCVRIKGASMAPTLQDGGYMIIRLLDKGEWAKMHDERIFVVVDNDNNAYLKRVKNRFKQGYIVLRSDNPDQASYPSITMEAKEVQAIWYAEWYFSAKMPNVHDQFYSRLQQLEDKVDLLARGQAKINLK